MSTDPVEVLEASSAVAELGFDFEHLCFCEGDRCIDDVVDLGVVGVPFFKYFLCLR